jgi:hypothetical protein
MQTAGEIIMMPPQEMNYSEIGRDRSGSTYGRYEGIPFADQQGAKLPGPARSQVPTASQRLALAITSLVLLMLLTFVLVVAAIAAEAPGWMLLPIIFILFMFSTVTIIINIVFNHKA